MPPARAAFAEFVGAFALMFIGGGAIIMGGDLLTVALAHGLILAVMVSASLQLSGAQFNPAVSITVAAIGKQPWPQAILFIIVQLAGATLAAFLLKTLLTGVPGATVGNVGATLGTLTDGEAANAGKAVALEIIATFFLMFVILGSAIDGKSWTRSAAGFAIGLVIAGDILMVGPLTGASMNPSRSFGPALVAGVWQMQWVYWVGPIVGALLAGITYRALYLGKAS